MIVGLYIYKNIRNIIYCINNKMSSYSTQYRRDHPEWREAEKIRNNEREKNKYNNDPDYKEQVKKRALERYYRMKEAKLNSSISVS